MAKQEMPKIEELETSPETRTKVFYSILEDVYAEKEKMAQQAKVNFSLLEDVDTAQKELKQKYEELNVIRKVAEEVGYTLDLKKVLDILSKSIGRLIDYTSVCYMLFEKEKGEVLFNAYLGQTVGPSYLNAIKKSAQEAFQALAPGQVARDLEAHYFGKKIDNESEVRALSFFNVPMIVQDKILGMLNIASTKPDLYRQKEMEPVYTIVSQASLAIVRLRELIASEHSRLKDLVESMTNGVLMFDIDKKVVIANPVMKKIVQLEDDKVGFSDFLKVFKEAVQVIDREEKAIDMSVTIDKVLSSAETVYFEEVSLKNKFFEIFVTPVRDYRQQIFGGTIILHDITHRKKVEMRMTEFVSIASHQLRTPLTAIKLFVEMLANEEVGKLGEKQKDYMDNVQQSTERMIKLVNELLNVSRLEAGRLRIEPRLIQLEKFIREIINALKPEAATRKCEVIFRKPRKKLAKIPIDPSLIRQVIRNLVSNAIHYSPEKKCKVFVTLKKRNKEEYLIGVRDNGIGIPKAAQERIFEKFFRADNAMKAIAEGSGLGLYVCKMIIEASGGKIWFEFPGKGKGTTFYITIPIKGMPKKKGEKGLAA